MASLLHNRRFILYNSKNSFVNIGYNLYQITIPFFSFIYFHSIVFTGIILFVEYGIYTLTFLSGPIVDKVEDRRYIMFLSEIVIGISALILALLIHIGRLNEYIFIAIVAFMAIGHDIMWTADWTVIPIIVDKEDLPRANGYSNAIGNASSTVGFVLGGFLIIVFNAFFSMVLYSLCLFAASFLTLVMPIALTKGERKMRDGLISGWRYVFKGNSNLLILSIIISIFSFFSLLPVLGITYIFASSSSLYYSLMFSLFYVGAMFSGIAIGKYFPLRFVGKAMFGSLAVMGILLVAAVVLSSLIILDTLFWFLIGFFSSSYYTIYRIYLKIVTPKEIIGRTASNLYTFQGIATALGSVFFPILFLAYGIHSVFIISGILITIFSIVFPIIIPSIMQLSATTTVQNA